MDNGLNGGQNEMGAQPVQPQPMPVGPQPQPAPVMPEQPVAQPLVNGGAPETNTAGPKKTNMALICAIIGGVVLIAVVVVLLIVFLGHGGKTVSCTYSRDIYGMSIKAEYNIKVENGRIPGADATVTIDLKNLSSTYKNSEKELVDSFMKSLESECKGSCKMNKDYVTGDYAKATLNYEEEGVTENLVYGFGFEKMSAQEIADELQEQLERSLPGGATCKQN